MFFFLHTIREVARFEPMFFPQNAINRNYDVLTSITLWTGLIGERIRQQQVMHTKFANKNCSSGR